MRRLEEAFELLEPIYKHQLTDVGGNPVFRKMLVELIGQYEEDLVNLEPTAGSAEEFRNLYADMKRYRDSLVDILEFTNKILAWKNQDQEKSSE